MAQTSNLEQRFNAIEIEHSSSRNTRTTLDSLSILRKDAERTQQWAWLYRIVSYNYSLELRLQDTDATSNGFQRLETEILAASPSLKPLYHAAIAFQYHLYLTSNQNNLRSRTQAPEVDTSDLRTWDIDALMNRIEYHYAMALKSSVLLQSYKSVDWKPATKGEDQWIPQRPTLFDVIVHQALEYYKGESPKPFTSVNEFAIKDDQFYATGDQFLAWNLIQFDTSHRTIKALKLYQELERFHVKSNSKFALYYNTIDRLVFVYNKDVRTSDRGEKLLSALKSYYSANQSHDESIAILKQYIESLMNVANGYVAGSNDPTRWLYRDILALCNPAIERWGSNKHPLIVNDLNQIRNTKGSIEAHFSNCVFEKQVYPNKPFLVNVEYKNLKSFTIEYRKLSESDFRDINILERNDRNAVIELVTSRFPDSEQLVTVPDAGDYRNHTVLVSQEGLPVGNYLITIAFDSMRSHRPDLLLISSLAFSYCSGTDISRYYINDYISGQPFKFVDVDICTYVARYPTSKNETILKHCTKAKSDDTASFEIPESIVNFKLPTRDYPSRLVIGKINTMYGEELIEIPSYYGMNDYMYPRGKEIHSYFYLDRSIYRPGQTVHFKAMLIQSDHSKVVLPLDILSSTNNFNVYVYNVNNQKILTIPVQFNEFGTAHGSFVLPTTGLTGNHQLKLISNKHNISYSNNDFSVEEYKRPKFEVSMDEVKEEVSLGDSIHVPGKAMSFAGSPVSNAFVSYKVSMYSFMPWWCGYGGDRSSETIVLVGETQTDGKGKFMIDFLTARDDSKFRKYYPIYTYTIEVDVVDLTGETRSASHSLSIGSQSVYPNVVLPKSVSVDEGKFSVSINHINAESQAVYSSGAYFIHKVEKYSQPLKSVLWSKVDTFIYSEVEFRELFPHEDYASVNSEEKLGPLLSTGTYAFKGLDSLSVKLSRKWKPGVYKFVIKCQDAKGLPIEQSQYFFVSGDDEADLAEPTFMKISAPAEVLPNQTLRIKLETSLQTLYVLWNYGRPDQQYPSRWRTINGPVEFIDLPIYPSDTGSEISFRFMAIAHNRMHSQSLSVRVPLPTNQLKFKWETFRSKIDPGQKEVWRLRITEPDGKPASAELLASMYDASLDLFAKNMWHFPLALTRYGIALDYESHLSRTVSCYLDINITQYVHDFGLIQLRDIELSSRYNRYYKRVRGNRSSAVASPAFVDDMGAIGNSGNEYDEDGDQFGMEFGDAGMDHSKGKLMEIEALDTGVAMEMETSESNPAPAKPIVPRKNLQETAFFYPQLRTDEKGDVMIEFEAPEALTRWNLMLLAHTKQLHYKYLVESVVTHKQLMVMPQVPRFVRVSDELLISARIDNQSEEPITCTASLLLFDAFTGKPVSLLMGGQSDQLITVPSKEGAPVHWKVRIPEGLQALTWRITAGNADFSDGEENVIPVLPSKMLVAESLPINVRGKGEHSFTFDALKNNISNTLRHERLTFEFTPNPIWYAVQSMPYLMEFPHECAEQLFSRLYANSIATIICDKSPRIKEVFRIWRDMQPSALLSQLEKNPELKNIALEETPWVFQAQSQTDQKRRLGLLFDLNRMAQERDAAIKKLVEMQHSNGGFSWFPGSRYLSYSITLHVVTGINRMLAYGVEDSDKALAGIATKGQNWLDGEVMESYEKLKKSPHWDPKANYYYTGVAHYLYAKFTANPKQKIDKEYLTFWISQAQKHWNVQSWYGMAYTALALHAINPKDPEVARIVEALRQNLIRSEEFGARMKYDDGYGWYNGKIETQALVIEVFETIAQDKATADELKIWLLKQKQTTHWPTTKSTVEACHALIMRGTDWLNSDEEIDIVWGGEKLKPEKVEAGTGAFKVSLAGSDVNASKAEIVITKQAEGVSWGAMYWQYFEQLDKIKFAQTPVRIRRAFYVKTDTDIGPKLVAITDTSQVNPGDEIVVRIELYVDRDLDFVHLKDMRPAGLEPVDVLSGHKYQSSLNWYQSTRDVATHFFFQTLPKGNYVLEYSLRAFSVGDFLAGPAFLQCMYAPEYSAHTAGSRFEIFSR